MILPLNNGHILTKSPEQDKLIEFDQLGRVYSIFSLSYQNKLDQTIPFYAIRDMVQTQPGDDKLLIQGEDDSAAAQSGANQTEGDVLVIMDFATKQALSTVDYKELLDVNRKPQPPSQQDNSAGRLDWYHQNSIHYHESTSVYIGSSRNQNVIVATDQATNQIRWMLGSHANWSSDYANYLLTPLKPDGTPYDLTDPVQVTQADHEFWHWGQHGVRSLPDDHTTAGGDLDIIVFDDGAYRSLNQPDSIVSYENWSRAVRYSINLTNMTARIVWEYGKSLGQDYYCGYVGNVLFLPDTNSMMINFGGTNLYTDSTATSRNVGIHGDVLMGDFPPAYYNNPTAYPVYEKTKVQEVSMDTNEVLFEFWQYSDTVGIIQNFGYKVWKLDLYDFKFDS